ncbi:NAD(P)/FAD-dependent oxidoreductase [Fodinibius sp. Rm-B-1B1-1]|uniref:NAD(P)/FAD-dependent oxidoreductase n=1 Tax=Fodinibius alkaliphilus TaxID=3140241 RepID=UPI00315A6740
MVIGIIGASISGLIAGKRLAEAGHDVTIIEKNRSLGGRLKTVALDDLTLDVGLTHFDVETNTFGSFVSDMESKGAIQKWTKEFSLFDGAELYDVDPNSDARQYYCGTAGLQDMAESMSRWVDIKSEEKAGGLTYIGPDRTRKRSWMINLTDVTVFECDAVIIATSAVDAYGVIQTAQNRTQTRKIIRHIDEVRYDGCFSLAATYENQGVPSWRGIECEHSSIRWISNESSKQNTDTAALVIQSTPDFYRKHAQKSEKEIQELLLEEASEIIGGWAHRPKSTYVENWKYFNAQNSIDEYFMELEMEDAPLALIGDYLGGSSLENAFVSGYNLAEYWIKKYSEVTV